MPRPEAARRVVILGAAGRDFHVFQTLYRDDPAHLVVAFTATQIPGIAGREFPAELAGPLYPDGIPILPEERLEEICRGRRVDEVVFAYSDVTHAHVMHLASRALALGADFRLPGPAATMLRATRPVIAVTALRTGAGKSPVARWLARLLIARGYRVAVIRHPMPYGQLQRQRVQRFASVADMEAARCTVEEREEYEPHVALGTVVFAGIDYAAILRAAEAEADILVWDGGNNDFPFIRPDLMIAVADALRPDQVSTHHPGEAVARMADILLINKTGAAPAAEVAALAARLAAVNPAAPIARGDLPVTLDGAATLAGRRVLVVEDGPTVTHGGMPHGAGFLAATRAGAVIVDPRPFAVGSLREAYVAYPHLGPVLPALGYSQAQVQDLAASIAATEVDAVVSATPADIGALVRPNRPVLRARYAFAEDPSAPLTPLLERFLASLAAG
jgi:predicted GTPase